MLNMSWHCGSLSNLLYVLETINVCCLIKYIAKIANSSEEARPYKQCKEYSERLHR